MRFDLTDLRLFLSVIDCASITQGASNAHIAPASASERIRNMEHEIGTQLLLREARGVRPTAAGSALARHARIILQQNEIMRGELFEFADGLRGRVRLLTNTAGLFEFLPGMLADYLLKYPKIDLEIEERPSHEIVQAISSGDFDAGLVADIVPTGQLRCLPCFVDQLVLVVPARQLFSDMNEIEFARAVTQDFVGLMGDSALMEHLEWQASRLTKSIHWRVRLSTFEAVCNLVERGVGVAVVPERAAVKARTRGSDLAMVTLSDSWARRQLMLCVRDLDELPNHAKLFVDHLMSKADAGSA
jgi:DNA-binding transcriptional LysR family regulator